MGICRAKWENCMWTILYIISLPSCIRGLRYVTTICDFLWILSEITDDDQIIGPAIKTFLVSNRPDPVMLVAGDRLFVYILRLHNHVRSIDDRDELTIQDVSLYLGRFYTCGDIRSTRVKLISTCIRTSYPTITFDISSLSCREMDLPPNIWGPFFWHMLHYFAVAYTPDKQMMYQLFFDILHVILPCRSCAEHYRVLHGRYVISHNIYDSTYTMCRYVYDIHNQINLRLRKRHKVSFNDFINFFDSICVCEITFVVDCQERPCTRPL